MKDKTFECASYKPIMHLCKLMMLTAAILGIPLWGANQTWVERSNENALYVLKAFARFNPENAASEGLEGFDDQVLDLKPRIYERGHAAVEEALKTLQARRSAEKDPLVRQDLDILITTLSDNLHSSEVRRERVLPYFNITEVVFGGIHGLLDEQISAARRPAALVRLKRYTGLEPGYTPIVTLAEERLKERLATTGLLGPARMKVEKDLSNAPIYINGIGQLFEKYKIAGYQEAYGRLKEQLAGYNEFLRKEVLPRSREDFRLPPEIYALNLKSSGIDIGPEQLAAKAHAAFTEIQGQMQVVASKLAKEKGWPAGDYRDAIRRLKKDQIVGDAILEHYRKRLAQIEDIVRREHLVTLPERAARIRLATAAESAQIPAPHMDPPRLVGNTGEKGEFVLPVNVPSNSGKMENFDDFTFDAASWTLTSHEARPGHELQFDAMVERGVSLARAEFAFNSTNVEGWGLYAEWMMQPFMPLDGQLICLQHRLLRAARAFLDPELHMGKTTQAEALRVLKEDVVLSNAMAKQEAERYMYRAPGQAPSYFYGYTRLLELRHEVEKALGPRFNAQRYHDFILSQGLLPPNLLRKAVMENFVGPKSTSASN